MDLTDWLLFLHVLAAFAYAASVVVYGVVLAGARTPASGPRPALGLMGLGRRLWDIGGVGTLVLGIALALDIDGYQIWDGWILAALVLWGVSGYAGEKMQKALIEARDGESRELGARGGLMFAVMAAAVAAVLIVMIYKPGA